MWAAGFSVGPPEDTLTFVLAAGGLRLMAVALHCVEARGAGQSGHERTLEIPFLTSGVVQNETRQLSVWVRFGRNTARNQSGGNARARTTYCACTHHPVQDVVTQETDRRRNFVRFCVSQWGQVVNPGGSGHEVE